jgi:hypothetical protein
MAALSILAPALFQTADFRPLELPDDSTRSPVAETASGLGTMLPIHIFFLFLRTATGQG